MAPRGGALHSGRLSGHRSAERTRALPTAARMTGSMAGRVLKAAMCRVSSTVVHNQRTSCHERKAVGTVGLDCGDASVAARSHSGGRRFMRGINTR